MLPIPLVSVRCRIILSYIFLNRKFVFMPTSQGISANFAVLSLQYICIMY